MRTFLFVICCMLGNLRSVAESIPIYIVLSDTTIIDSITPQGKPVFTIQGMNAIIGQYTVTGFKKAFPGSRYTDMQKIYQMNVSAMTLPTTLKTSYPNYFTYYAAIPVVEELHTPDDYTTSWPERYTGYLDYINAPSAWDVTKGDPDVIIGITDTYLDTAHPDMIGKIAQVGPNVGSGAHGTMVSGLVAAATNNNLGYPSIGYKCRIDFSSRREDGEMLNMSARKRRVLNASWMYGLTPALDLSSPFFYIAQKAYQEIYENGTLTCIAAANGHGHPWYYAYPASLDYVFSTSNVGYEIPYGSPGASFNVKGVHEIYIGDTSSTIYQHNPRVDILAPSVRIGGLTYDPGNPDPNWRQYTWDGGWGTSCGSPLTAGTAGLMVSKNPCLSPYQLEYILKTSADSSILSLPENLKYAGRLGAGALDAGNTLLNVKDGFDNPATSIYGCNNPATATFFIDGIDINTICAPTFGSVNPILKPVLRNGTPPYTYRWEYEPGNETTLSAFNIANPEIATTTGSRLAYYRLTVYDNSPIPKVASRYFKMQLTTANTFDLAGMDSYMDMLDEPNSMTVLDPRETQYYKSPDLWNRQLNDGGTVHENPEYFSSNDNYAHVRIRNVGCAPYPGGSRKLKLYWTVGSTGEKWQDDWDGTTMIAGSSGFPVAGGGEITPGAGTTIPPLPSGGSTVMVAGWRPPRPQDYIDAPSRLNVCLLSRIIAPGVPAEGMTIPELISKDVITNVKNNNNIVTRNLWVSNLNTDKRTEKIRVYVANADAVTQHFNLQFINDKAIYLHFAGDYSAIGSVTLYLGNLFDVWMAAGGQGTYLSRNSQMKTVVFDGSSTLELFNLELPAGVKYPVDIEFNLNPGIALPNYSYSFNFRQFVNNGGVRSDNVYGSMSFEVNTTDLNALAKNATQAFSTEKNHSHFSIHPNPVKNNLIISYLNDEGVFVDVTIFDITGRVILKKANQHFKNSSVEINVSDYVPGIYFVKIVNGKEIGGQFKFVKRN